MTYSNFLEKVSATRGVNRFYSPVVMYRKDFNCEVPWTVKHKGYICHIPGFLDALRLRRWIKHYGTTSNK